MMNDYQSLREQACAGNRQLPALGLVIYHFGNLSVADHTNRVFAIKPSGIPYEELTPEKMVIVDFDGNSVQGNLKPSSDTQTHAVLYKHWEKSGAIVHTHSTYATAWAQAQREIPIYGTTHADHFTGPIPCAPPMSDKMIAGQYEYQTGLQIINHLKENKLSYEEVEMILVANHAPFTWGSDTRKALYNSVILERIAQMAFLTEQINPDAKLLKEALIKKHYDRKHGPEAYYGQ
jgi:L-ribulose-5-phosphate 4-epimerase